MLSAAEVKFFMTINKNSNHIPRSSLSAEKKINPAVGFSQKMIKICSSAHIYNNFWCADTQKKQRAQTAWAHAHLTTLNKPRVSTWLGAGVNIKIMKWLFVTHCMVHMVQEVGASSTVSFSDKLSKWVTTAAVSLYMNMHHILCHISVHSALLTQKACEHECSRSAFGQDAVSLPSRVSETYCLIKALRLSCNSWFIFQILELL